MFENPLNDAVHVWNHHLKQINWIELLYIIEMSVNWQKKKCSIVNLNEIVELFCIHTQWIGNMMLVGQVYGMIEHRWLDIKEKPIIFQAILISKIESIVDRNKLKHQMKTHIFHFYRYTSQEPISNIKMLLEFDVWKHNLCRTHDFFSLSLFVSFFRETVNGKLLLNYNQFIMQLKCTSYGYNRTIFFVVVVHFFF